jgi:hypothetical protein
MRPMRDVFFLWLISERPDDVEETEKRHFRISTLVYCFFFVDKKNFLENRKQKTIDGSKKKIYHIVSEHSTLNFFFYWPKGLQTNRNLLNFFFW